MGLLNTAINTQRYDLAAYTLVYAAARSLCQGERPHDTETTRKQPDTIRDAGPGLQPVR
jgi:hypothetical protein